MSAKQTLVNMSTEHAPVDILLAPFLCRVDAFQPSVWTQSELTLLECVKSPLFAASKRMCVYFFPENEWERFEQD